MALRIKVILGSTRPNRFGEKPAEWITNIAKTLPDTEVELLDLRDWPLPFFNQPKSPSGVKDGNYGEEIVNKWAAKIGEADAFVIVSPEYNHSTSAVMKNALDSVYGEWNNKVAGFVSYGSVGGGRSIEHLRAISSELQMAHVRQAVYIPGDMVWGGKWDPADETLNRNAQTMLGQLVMWANALKSARTQSEAKA